MKTNGYARLLAVSLIVVTALCGCGEKEISKSNTSRVENSPFVEQEQQEETPAVSMKEIKSAVTDILGENYWPDHQLTKEELLEKTEIDESMYDEFLAENMNIETDIDMMIIIKAKKESISDVEKALNDYREKLLAGLEGRPQEYGKAEASRIEIIDQYICFVQLGAGASGVTKADAEKVLAVCLQENERAVDAIEKAILE